MRFNWTRGEGSKGRKDSAISTVGSHLSLLRREFGFGFIEVGHARRLRRSDGVGQRHRVSQIGKVRRRRLIEGKIDMSFRVNE